MLQFADIHVDFQYKPGSQADCLEPLCCRKGPPRTSALSSPSILQSRRFLCSFSARSSCGWFLVSGVFVTTVPSDLCRGTPVHCDLPFWTAQAIMGYAGKTEEVLHLAPLDAIHPTLFFSIRSISYTTRVTPHPTMCGISLVRISSTHFTRSTV